jgi:hypothetical protein
MFKVSKQTWPIFAFLPFTLLMLFCDSRLVTSLGIDGQIVPNVLVPVYLVLMLLSVAGPLRWVMLLTIPSSLLAENLCSNWLGLYTYKSQEIPLYVPFGHAIVLGTGFLLARQPLVVAKGSEISKALIAFYAVLVTFMALEFYDTLSLPSGIVFFTALRFKKWQPFYLLMGLIVLTVELAGTAFGCWAWKGKVLGLFSTTNPPVGAMVLYVLGDILVVSAAVFVSRNALLSHVMRRLGRTGEILDTACASAKG